MTRLWTGETLRHPGKHFRVSGVRFRPAPVQQPRPPIWVAGIWPRRPPFRRAARWDGVFPLCQTRSLPTPGEIREIRAYVATHRESAAPFDVVVAGTSEPSGSAPVTESALAGATWWLEWLEPERGSLEEMRVRVRSGPPALAARAQEVR